MGVEFIGFEINPEYVELCNERLGLNADEKSV